MKNIKRTLSVILALILCMTTIPAVFSATTLPFRDVKNSDWYYDAVSYVYENQIMNGMTEKTFSPSGNTTRAQLVTILARIDGAETEGCGQDSFSDVTEGKWYYDAVGWAVGEGLVNGYEDGTFKPDAAIKRQELAALFDRFMTHQYMVFADAPICESFTDSTKIPSWAASSVEKIRLAGIIGGDNNGNFNPSKSASRAEISTMIMRYMEGLKNARDPMVEKLNNIYDLTEGEGNSINIYLDYRDRIAGNGTSKSLAVQLLPQMGLDTDVYTIEVNKKVLPDFIKATDCSITGGQVSNNNGESSEVNTGMLPIKIVNTVTGNETAFKPKLFSVIRSFGEDVIDPDTFEPGVDAEVYADMTEKSQYSSGKASRYAAFIEKVESGEPVTVAYIGGSVTRGASAGDLHSYTKQVQNWLEKTYPQSKMKYINAGIDGTTSSFGTVRFGADVLKFEPDLLFIEFAINDSPDAANQEAYESIVRKALDNDMAVILHLVSNANAANCEYMKQVADHYGLAVTDCRSAAEYGKETGEVFNIDFDYDGAHPREWGHSFMADMLTETLKNIAADVADATDEEKAAESIPEERLTVESTEFLESNYPENCAPSSKDGWDISYGIYKSQTAWTSSDPSAELVYEFDGSYLYVLTHPAISDDESYDGSYYISIDGSDPQQNSGDFEITLSEGHHTVTITPAGDKRVVIASFVYK